MTTAVAELPAAASAVEIATAAPRPKDRYRWLAAQHDALALSLGAGRAVPGVDLGGINEELADEICEVRMTFVSHVKNIYGHMARIQIVGVPDLVGSMAIEIEAFRRDCARFMLERPSLRSQYGDLFDAGRSSGIFHAAKKLSSQARQSGAKDADQPGLLHDFENRMEAECIYSFEHVLAFDQRKSMRLSGGANQGRAMTEPDPRTYPPAVARVINAGISDPDKRLPILEEDRMAQDPPEVVYERILERDRRRTRV